MLKPDTNPVMGDPLRGTETKEGHYPNGIESCASLGDGNIERSQLIELVD